MQDMLAKIKEMGVDPDQLLAEFRAEQERRILENRLKHYKPYAKQRQFHEMGATKRERLFVAANQCLTPWTVLQTDRGERQIADMIGAGGFGVQAWDGASLCDAQAEPVFLKSIEPAFLVRLDNGREFQCSRRHRVLTSEGWLSLVQLVSRASDLRCFDTRSGSMASCAGDGYLRGPEPQSAADSALARLPSLAGVLLDNPMSGSVDEGGQRSSHIRASRWSDLPPTVGDDPSQLAALCARPEFHRTASLGLRSMDDARELLQSDLGSSLVPLEIAASPLGDSEGLCFVAACWPRLVGSAQIVSVEQIGYQPILDFTVPGPHNYEAAGVIHHNSGKTLAGSAEAAMHLTGRYPDWWKGRRFPRAITCYAGSVTRETTRDGLQRLLLGRAGSPGTGMIPKDCILNAMSASGVADAVSVARIKHVSGTPSTVIFKSYDMGRERWQADTVDLVVLDEEPPIDIYTEALTRTNTVTDALVYLTFTPLLGMSDVVRRFLTDKNEARGVVTMTIHDAEHYTPEQRQTIIDSYQDWERDARTLGVPTMGSGRVYPVLEAMLAEDGQKIPDYWAKICGIDFGYDHPAAMVWMAWDRDADTVHVYDCHRVRLQTPIQHAPVIRARGIKIPVAWPHDGLNHEKGSGIQLAQLYREQGIAMLPERAKFPDDRGNFVEPGVVDILDRMQTGRLKVARHLNDWWEEFRLYHRDEGKIVKEHDDIMDAMRYGIMCLRFAKAAPRPEPAYRVRNKSPQSAWAA